MAFYGDQDDAVTFPPDLTRMPPTLTPRNDPEVPRSSTSTAIPRTNIGVTRTRSTSGTTTVPIYDTSSPNPLDGNIPQMNQHNPYGGVFPDMFPEAPELRFDQDGVSVSEFLLGIAGAILTLKELDKFLKDMYRQAVYMSDPRLVQAGYRPEGRATRAWHLISQGLQHVWVPLWWSGEHMRNEQVAVALRDAALAQELDHLYLVPLRSNGNNNNNGTDGGNNNNASSNIGANGGSNNGNAGQSSVDAQGQQAEAAARRCVIKMFYPFSSKNVFESLF